MKRHRVGIIGLGARAETFARTLYRGTERGELFGLCDIDDDRLRKFCDYCEFKNPRCFTDPEEFFRQREMDAVIVTTPDFTHLEIARQAFAAGKHTYLEKPLDVTAERCREIIRLHEKSKVAVYVGFNLRALPIIIAMKEAMRSGVLGQVVHIEGLEQLAVPHGAAFMRRFHRHTARSGGLLNTKCCHDLDVMLWLIGHEHRVRRVASFGGTNVFLPEKGPPGHGATCGECPGEIRHACPYVARAGYVFPVRGDQPIYKTRETEIYGGDLCVYNADKDIVDNQTVILEWDNGVRGNFNLQLFQHKAHRSNTIWGEKGVLEADVDGERMEITMSDTGDKRIQTFAPRPGGHGGTDPFMLGRFFDAIEGRGVGDSGLREGLAATMVAEKALQSMRSGRVMPIVAEEYG